MCDFRCRDESYLSKHMLTHSDDKKFMCSECGYITKWKHYLNVHMRKHAGDLRYLHFCISYTSSSICSFSLNFTDLIVLILGTVVTSVPTALTAWTS